MGFESSNLAARPPFFSVVIPCYNYAQFLPLAVSSVIEQSFPDYEIIIVNDGSTDDTAVVAQKLVQENPRHRIKVINQANAGQPAIARNNGIRESNAPYIICLDADDMMDAHMLRKCAVAIESDPDISVVYTNAIFFNEEGSEVKESGQFDLALLVAANQLFCCSLFSKQAWELVGGYKTNVRGYEDWDFWISLAELGVKAHKISEPLFFYRTKKDGLFADAVDNDLLLKTNIILNHPRLYDEDAKIWAKSFLAQNK